MNARAAYSGMGFPFTVTDNSYTLSGGVSGGTLSIDTTLTAAIPLDLTAGIGVAPDLMRNWSCSNCTGSADAIDFSQAPAQNRPLYTYSNRTYTCTANLPNIPNSLDLNSPPDYQMIGNFDSLILNVSTPDTGPNATLYLSSRNPNVNQVTGAFSFFDVLGDLKTAGIRTVTPTTTSGVQPNDIITAPGANSWLAALSVAIAIDHDLTTEPAAQCPVVTVTWQATR